MPRNRSDRGIEAIPGGRHVLLPRILGFRLTGFQPKFSKDLVMRLQPGPNVVLGGNGLGKTTIMQAVLYGLTGGLSRNLEKDKRYRWDHRYFRKRLEADCLRLATVEVDFALGAGVFSIRRKFNTSLVSAFRSSPGVEWIIDHEAAIRELEQSLQRSGGYNSVDDFSFILHRLLYLPESRRLLAWDTDAQVQLLMLFSPNVIDERSFQRRRAELKRTDSAKRHVHVVMGHLKDQFQGDLLFLEDDDRPQIGAPQSLGLALDILQRTTSGRQAEERRALEIERELSARSEEVESLREQIEVREASVIAESIARIEVEVNLALQKLVDRGICPACGTHAPHLQATAQLHARNEECILCGTNEPRLQLDDPELSTLYSQLRTKLAAQQLLEDQRRVLRQRISIIQKKEEDLQSQINQAESTAPFLALLERRVSMADPRQDARETYKQLFNQEAEYGAQIVRTRTELEREFAEFRESVGPRISRFQDLYKEYATAFLGMECSLVQINAGDRLLELPRFVPRFDGTTRETENDCSEAQRFFLDIAFRMAMIDWASALASASASFLCETPETALDMSYVENVVSMFKRFSEKEHMLLLTSNIQADGLAAKLLQDLPRGERGDRVLNLLDYGQLTEVHRQSIAEMRQVIRRSLS